MTVDRAGTGQPEPQRNPVDLMRPDVGMRVEFEDDEPFCSRCGNRHDLATACWKVPAAPVAVPGQPREPMAHCCFAGCTNVTCGRCGVTYCANFPMHDCRPSAEPDCAECGVGEATKNCVHGCGPSSVTGTTP